MYENNGGALHEKSLGWPLLQHEGQVYVLLASAHVDVATVLGVGSVVEGEAGPEQAAQHHQGVASLRLDAPGPWGGSAAWVLWSQTLPTVQRPRLLGQPGPGAKSPGEREDTCIILALYS